jgi:hypothetical protein
MRRRIGDCVDHGVCAPGQCSGESTRDVAICYNEFSTSVSELTGSFAMASMSNRNIPPVLKKTLCSCTTNLASTANDKCVLSHLGTPCTSLTCGDDTRATGIQTNP